MARKKNENQMDLPLGDEPVAKAEEIEIIKDPLDNEEEIKVESADEKEEEPKEEGLEPEIGINELKAQLEKERQARFDAEKRAKEAAESARTSRMDVERTNLQLLETAIETIKQDNASLKNRLRDAMQIGDHETVFEVQELIAKNTFKLENIEDGRKRLEAQIKNPQVEAPDDPVEALASQLTPRSADWVRRHPQCVTDQRLYQKMIAAHNLAVADGYVPDSDDYFDFIEDTMKLNQRAEPRREMRMEEDDSPLSSAATATKQRTAPPAAPVSRTASSGNPRQNVVRLSKDEREMAQMMGMTDQEYARNKAQLIKEGKLN
jgi:hypothetical protein